MLAIMDIIIENLIYNFSLMQILKKNSNFKVKQQFFMKNIYKQNISCLIQQDGKLP